MGSRRRSSGAGGCRRDLILCLGLLFGGLLSPSCSGPEDPETTTAVAVSDEALAPEAGALETNADTLAALDAGLKAGILTEEEYRAKHDQLVGPDARAPRPAEEANPDVVVPPEESTEVAPGGPPVNPLPRQEGLTYRHPSGVSFWYPKSWTLEELPGIAQLLPPGVELTADRYEAYYVTGESMAEEGITSVDDPRVARSLNEMLTAFGEELGVVFRRRGKPMRLPGLGAGAGNLRMDWTAQSNLGPLKAFAVATIVGDYGMVLAGIGVKDLLREREPDAMRIVASFRAEEGLLDPRLVGTWNLVSTYAVQNDSVWETDYSRAQAVSETKSALRFIESGRWQRRDESHLLVGAGGIWLENKDTASSSGRWNAGEGRLFLLWEDESFQDYRYRLEGEKLHMLAEGKGTTWERGE